MPNATPTKRCSRCTLPLPLSEFGANRAMRDGLQNQCRGCRLETQREYRARKPEKMRELGRRNMRKRRDRDPEGVREYMRALREQNADAIRESKRAWNAANYERVREQSNERNRRWKAANPDVRRAEDARRRALLRSLPIGAIERVDLRALWVSQCGICALCGERIDESLPWPDPLSKSLDHIIPLARGGAHAQQNLQWVHLLENLRKGARLTA